MKLANLREPLGGRAGHEASPFSRAGKSRRIPCRASKAPNSDGDMSAAGDDAEALSSTEPIEDGPAQVERGPGLRPWASRATPSKRQGRAAPTGERTRAMRSWWRLRLFTRTVGERGARVAGTARTRRWRDRRCDRPAEAGKVRSDHLVAGPREGEREHEPPPPVPSAAVRQDHAHCRSLKGRSTGSDNLRRLATPSSGVGGIGTCCEWGQKHGM